MECTIDFAAQQLPIHAMLLNTSNAHFLKLCKILWKHIVKLCKIYSTFGLETWKIEAWSHVFDAAVGWPSADSKGELPSSSVEPCRSMLVTWVSLFFFHFWQNCFCSSFSHTVALQFLRFSRRHQIVGRTRLYCINLYHTVSRILSWDNCGWNMTCSRSEFDRDLLSIVFMKQQ
jgi:hypothetical protein